MSRDIRNATTKEEEKKRVNAELANIRTKFKQSDKLSPYDRKKCAGGQRLARGRAPHSRPAQVCVEAALRLHARLRRRVWPHRGALRARRSRERTSAWALGQAVGLISSPKYAEKQVGYMVTSVLLNEARVHCACQRAPNPARSTTSFCAWSSTASRRTSPAETTPSRRWASFLSRTVRHSRRPPRRPLTPRLLQWEARSLPSRLQPMSSACSSAAPCAPLSARRRRCACCASTAETQTC